MKKFLSVIVGSLIILSAIAQPPKTYNETLRDKERTDYNNAYIDALRKNTNTPYKQVGIDKKAVQELADLFAARAGRKTSAQIAAEEQAAKKASQAYYEELQQKQKIKDIQNSKEVDIHENYRKPLMADYLSAGFNSSEASHYAYAEVKSDKGILELAPNPSFYRAKGVLAEIKSKEKTAPFTEIITLILDLQATPAPVTSLAKLQSLTVRFPEKTGVIHEAMAHSFRTYFVEWSSKVATMRKGKSGSEKIVLMDLPTGAFKYMLDSYEAYLNYNPTLALSAFKNIKRNDYHPLVSLVAIAAHIKDKKKVEDLCRLFLMSPNPDDAAKLSSTDYRNNAYERIYYVNKYNYSTKFTVHYDHYPDEVLVPYSADDIKKIAQAQGLKPINVLEAIWSYYSYDRFARGGRLSKEEKKAWKFDDLLKDLADGGDADALAVLNGTNGKASITNSDVANTNNKKTNTAKDKNKPSNKNYLFTDWASAKTYEWLWLETEKNDPEIYRVLSNNKLRSLQYTENYTWALADMKSGSLKDFTYTANIKTITSEDEKGSSGLLMQAKQNPAEKNINILFLVNPLKQTYWFGYYNTNNQESKALVHSTDNQAHIYSKAIQKLVPGKTVENLLSMVKSGDNIDLLINSQKVQSIPINFSNAILKYMYGIGLASLKKAETEVDKISFSIKN